MPVQHFVNPREGINVCEGGYVQSDFFLSVQIPKGLVKIRMYFLYSVAI